MLRYCAAARGVLLNGYFQPASQFVAAALRLVELGYLTRVVWDGDDRLVVKLTDANVSVMRGKVGVAP